MIRWTRLPVVLAISIVVSISGGVAFAALGGAPKASSAAVNLQQGLIGWWKFDGNFKDSSATGGNGLASNGPVGTADRFGKANSAYAFNGTNQFVNFGSSTTWNTPNLTLAAWVLNTSSSGFREILAKELNYKIRLNGTNLDLLVGSTGSSWSTTRTWTNVVPINTWTHVAVTVDSTGRVVNAYVNGTAMGSSPLAPITSYNNNGLFGATYNSGGAEVFQGALDDLRFYNRALTSADVTALYNYVDQKPDVVLKAATGSNGLVGQWNFDGNVKDSSPFANNGTASGITYAADRKGSANGAAGFSGTSIVTAPASAVLEQTQAVTVALWVKPSVLSGLNNGQATLVTKNASGSSNVPYSISARNGGGLNAAWRVSVGGDSNGYATMSTASGLQIGRWSLVALTRTATNAYLYADGQLVASSAFGYTTNPPVPSGTTLNIGGATSQFSGFTGSIDDVRIYNRALSQQELALQFAQYNSQLSTGNLQRGLVGSWNMNGNAKDATPNASNCTLAGSPTLTTDRKGRANSAYAFNGSSDLRCGTSPALQPSTAVTMSAWVYSDNWDPTGTTTHNGVVNYGSGGYWLWIQPSGVPNLYFQDSAFRTDGFGAGSPLPTGTWSHLTATYDGVNSKLYVNGNLVGSTPTVVQSIGNYSGGTGFEIGSVKRIAGRYMNGKIDDVRIWNRALTASEVAQLSSEYR